MKRNIFKTILACTVVACSAVSCDFLDVGNEMSGGLQSNEDIFNDVGNTRRFYEQCFNNIPDYSRIWNADAGIGGGWACFADEIYTNQANKTGRYGAFTSYTTSGHRWYDLYKSIRQCNIFLEWVHPIEADGQYADRLSQEEVDAYTTNVRFLRAMYHYYLFEQYGPIPLVKSSFNMETLQDLPRNTVDETVGWISSELAWCAGKLPQTPYHDDETGADFRALPTKGVALAFRAKLLTYAASPLFNGSWAKGKELVNNDGTPLFPDVNTKDKKINDAVAALKELIDYAEAGNYELYVAPDGNPHRSLYELFQNYNKEIIWATAKNSWGGLSSSAENFDSHSTPPVGYEGKGGMNLLQELIDDFYCIDGYSISDNDIVAKSNKYDESVTADLDGTNGGYIPSGDVKEYYAITGKNVNGMYLNREPRFYNTVTFHGKTWTPEKKDVEFVLDGNSNVGATRSFSGYLLYKRYARDLGRNEGDYKDKQPRPSIIFRLAEFYLLYAEMVNEMDPADERVLTYLNKVRVRAGLPEFGDDFGADIVGDQAKQRLAIQRESRLELATEGQRYFDVRRWLIADTDEGRQGGDFYGMDVNKKDPAEFHNRVWCQTRVFEEKNYLYPLPLDEIKRSKELKQNPGW